MKRALMICAIASVAFLSSCKKDKKFDQDQQESQVLNFKTNTTPPTSESFGSITSEKYVSMRTQKIINDFANSIKSDNLPGRPGACQKIKVSSILLSLPPICEPTAPVTVTYRCIVLLSPGGDDEIPLNQTFTITIANTYSGTTTLMSDVEFCDGQDPTVLFCPHLLTYDVTFIIPVVEYNLFNGGVLTTSTECTNGGSSFITFSENVSFCQPQSYYENSGPLLNFFTGPGNGNFNVLGQCSLLCIINPCIPCPLPSPFQYRIIGTSTWLTTTVPTGLPVSAAPGNYEYQCTLNYGTYTSLPGTGTFVVP